MTPMSKCEVCNERRGLMVNYAPGDAVWMAHPECAARHFQIRVKELESERNDAASESVENYKRASHYRDALERICDLVVDTNTLGDAVDIANAATAPKN